MFEPLSNKKERDLRNLIMITATVIGMAICFLLNDASTNTTYKTEIPSTSLPTKVTNISTSTSEIGCQRGCNHQKPNCKIKGNISFDTGEKIYHLPGDKYYSETKINPDIGERWFCTEEEAINNGWRHTNW